MVSIGDHQKIRIEEVNERQASRHASAKVS